MTPDFFRGCLFLQTNVCYVMPARFMTRLSAFLPVNFQNFSPKKQRDRISLQPYPYKYSEAKKRVQTANKLRRTKILKETTSISRGK